MRAIAERFGIEPFEYTNISPTIHGGDEVLPSQFREMPRTRKPDVGCNAGITHFHADYSLGNPTSTGWCSSWRR